MYKVFPLQGLILQDKIDIKLYNIRYTFFPRDAIGNIGLLKSDQQSQKDILDLFPNCETFVIIPEYSQQTIEIAFVKIGLGIIYFANMLKNRYDFFSSYYADLRIGTDEINENDFDLSIPVFYSPRSDTPSWRKSEFRGSPLKIENSIQNEVNSVTRFINKNYTTSDRLISAFYFIYYILPQTDIAISIVLISTILESLVLEESDIGHMKKSLSVRVACLVHDSGDKDEKIELAKHVQYFYELRSQIVHNGSFLKLMDDPLAVDRAKKSIYKIIEYIIKNDIQSIQDIRSIVTTNYEADELYNGFDYLKTNVQPTPIPRETDELHNTKQETT